MLVTHILSHNRDVKWQITHSELDPINISCRQQTRGGGGGVKRKRVLGMKKEMTNENGKKNQKSKKPALLLIYVLNEPEQQAPSC